MNLLMNRKKTDLLKALVKQQKNDVNYYSAYNYAHSYTCSVKWAKKMNLNSSVKFIFNTTIDFGEGRNFFNSFLQFT